MSTTQHPPSGTATTQPHGAPAAPQHGAHAPDAHAGAPQQTHPEPQEPPKVGMAHIVEMLGKGGGKDEDLEAMLTQQTRWDNEDVLALFQALRGKKAAAASGAPNAKAEGAKAH